MAYVSTKLTEVFDIREIITIHYFEYMKDFVFSGESHDFWEFLYVDRGEVLVRADDQLLSMKTGSVIFHKPNEFHAVKAAGNTSPNLVVISFRCDSPAMERFEKRICTLNDDERMLLSEIIKEADQAFATPLHIPSIEQVLINAHAPFGSEQLILLYLQIFLIYVERNHFDEKTESTATLPKNAGKYSLDLSSQPSSSDRMDHILQYLQYHICERLNIQDICSEFSISRSTLHALFHKEKGCGVIDYFNLLKIELSKEIIRDGKMNFTECAYYLSYGSLQYFSKQFKKTTGMSPMEYSNSVKKYSGDLNRSAGGKTADNRTTFSDYRANPEK